MKKAGSTVLLLAALLATILELHTACGQTTAKPTNTVPKEKPGICPPQRYHEKDPFNDAYCDTDEDCTGNKKCCVDNFDKMCKPPAKDGAYKCPTTSYDETSPKRTDFCSSNSECAPNATCCMKNGGKTCHPSVGVKSGECPPDPIRCIRGIRPACLDDSTCQGNEKCCSSKCGMECLPPIKEHSDPKQEVAPNQEAVKPVCPPARQERPGYCPLNFLKCAIREILCKDDLGCSDTEKCCISKCKRQCVPLLTDKPGVCPAPSTSCQKTNDTPDPNPVCTKDLHCTGDQKCCIVGCSQNCTEPTFV
ncbi:WAP four-disulfide core domain protein 3-like isoform X6 [Ambystoma mexicanum]|uniref:WAP four-disulfide core domain protein 3-like isoform X6 n=1 Tax=Ambystoma mexicanum TaxID=8296 RepID=UPI0037E8EB71